jgi:hypothetical protein
VERYLWEGGMNGGDEDEGVGLIGCIYMKEIEQWNFL